MGHEPGQDKVLFSRRLKPLVQIRADEGIGQVLDDHRLAGPGRDQIGDLADLGTVIIGRAGPGIMGDVEDGGAGVARAGEQPGRFGEGFLDANQGHDAGAIGVLAIDHHQGGILKGAGRGVEPDQAAQSLSFCHECLPVQNPNAFIARIPTPN